MRLPYYCAKTYPPIIARFAKLSIQNYNLELENFPPHSNSLNDCLFLLLPYFNWILECSLNHI